MQPPSDLDQRIAKLITLAPSRQVRTDVVRVRKYARLRIAALCAEEGRNRAATLIDERIAHMVSYEHEATAAQRVSLGEAAKLYRKGRKASQEVHASATSVLAGLTRFQATVFKNKSSLPTNLFNLANESARAIQSFEQLCDASSPQDDFIKTATARNKRMSPKPITASSQTLVWWRWYVGAYRGKWVDMQELASAWGVSKIHDRANFRAYVESLNKGSILFTGCPPWAEP